MIRTREKLTEALRGGALLRETRVHEPEDRSIWCIAGTDEGVHGQAVNLIRDNLQPLQDGMFGEAQTYAWSEQPHE